MRVVVDTNIVFSAILNTNGKIGDLLLNSSNVLSFFACDFLKEEIAEHYVKLKTISKLSDDNLRTAQEKIYSRLTFVDARILPSEVFIRAEMLLTEIDIDDTEHVALHLYLRGLLWTGDKKLQQGLRLLGIDDVVNTDELLAIRDQIERTN